MTALQLTKTESRKITELYQRLQAAREELQELLEQAHDRLQAAVEEKSEQGPDGDATTALIEALDDARQETENLELEIDFTPIGLDL